MRKRDKERLQFLLLYLTAHFADRAMQTVVISRGEARAIVAAIRELQKQDAA